MRSWKYFLTNTHNKSSKQWLSESPVGRFRHTDTRAPSRETWKIISSKVTSAYFFSKDTLQLHKLIDAEDFSWKWRTPYIQNVNFISHKYINIYWYIYIYSYWYRFLKNFSILCDQKQQKAPAWIRWKKRIPYTSHLTSLLCDPHWDLKLSILGSQVSFWKFSIKPTNWSLVTAMSHIVCVATNHIL